MARRRLAWTAPFVLGIVAALIALNLYTAMQPKPHLLDQSDVNRSIASALASQTRPPAISQQIYQALAPSLVLIQVQIPASAPSPGQSAPPSPNPSPAGADQVGVGSGVVADDAGDILTAFHVVSDATSIQVTFADGTTSQAQVVSSQPQNDIAVLQAAHVPSTVQPAVLGNPRSVQVGSEAFVLGNPFGLADSMTSGIVSGLNRSFRMPNGSNLTGLIQIDAAVNPGNSGGPLVNSAGQVVGIVTALINPTREGVFIGIGLAVPIDVATSGGPAQLPQY